MPSLIVEQLSSRTGGKITGRVLIGRLPTNGILVTDSSVSRLHAWIDAGPDGNYFVADTGSLTGTWVNGRAIEKRKTLSDGDVIKVGQAQIIFSADEHLPEGVSEIDLAGSPPSLDTADAGVLFACPCGAPVWFKATAIGQSHQCRHCGRTIRIPATPGAIAEATSQPLVGEPGVPLNAPVVALSAQESLHEAALMSDMSAGPTMQATMQMHPADEHGLAEVEEVPASAPHEPSNGESPATALHADPQPESARLHSLFQHSSSKPPSAPQAAVPAQRTCSICHSSISGFEPTTTCPSCGLSFHAGCWQENRGCSAYGCSQVGALAETQETPAEAADAVPTADMPSNGATDATTDEEATGFPWEFLFLATSVIGSVLGALVYGVPALIAAIGTSIYLAAFQESRKGRAVAVVALVVCILGAAVGVYASYIYWNGWPPIGSLAHRGGRQ